MEKYSHPNAHTHNPASAEIREKGRERGKDGQREKVCERETITNTDIRYRQRHSLKNIRIGRKTEKHTHTSQGVRRNRDRWTERESDKKRDIHLQEHTPAHVYKRKRERERGIYEHTMRQRENKDILINTSTHPPALHTQREQAK